MFSTRLVLKSLVERTPYPVGRVLAQVPFSLRLGSAYLDAERSILSLHAASADEIEAHLVPKLQRVVAHAYKNIPFYRGLYGAREPVIESLSDFRALPTVGRADVRKLVKESSGNMLVNTGGSTGGPLSFYVDHNAWAREWAHMHFAWSKRGYHPTELMITMLGKPLNGKLFRYNAIHNEFLVDPYEAATTIAPVVLSLCKKYPIKFFQGYPSNIYRVLKGLERLVPQSERPAFIDRFKGFLLSSEYPAEYIIRYLRDVWGISTDLSWYGHSEMCVFAVDYESNSRYVVEHTYGFAEHLDGMLVGTSYHNFDMPLIRYRTEDLIDPVVEEAGILRAFTVKAGRASETVVNSIGEDIPATFFISRHHLIYNYSDFIQIYQQRAGELVYFIVPSQGVQLDEENLQKYFDLPKNVSMRFSFRIVPEPVRTSRAKLKVKLTDEDVEGISFAESVRSTGEGALQE